MSRVAFPQMTAWPVCAKLCQWSMTAARRSIALCQGFSHDLRRFGAHMLETLRQDGFVPTHARRMGSGSWLLRAQPPREIQEGLGLAPEILLVAVDGEVQARDLQRAANEVVRSGLRLDSNLVVVTDGWTTLQERLKRISGLGQRVAWSWDDNEEKRFPRLSEVLRLRLPTYDVFDEYDPVRGNQVMGRDAEVAELKTRVIRGDAVGVFGLRKMGKTSLVRAVTDWLDPAGAMSGDGDVPSKPQAQVLWVDAEMLPPDATSDDVSDEILAALRRRAHAPRVASEQRMKSATAEFKAACEALLERGERLCFVIDEYDLLFEREGGRGPVPGLSYLFRLLRGWAQQWQGAVSLILIGRDPEHVSVPRLDGISNPLLAWFKPMWLGPLTPPRDAELLRRLGQRVGLSVGDETVALAHHWTGGHPMLLRQFGSALLQEVRRQHGDGRLGVATDPYREEAARLFIERRHVHTISREILDLLGKRFPAAHSLLLELVAAEGHRLDLTVPSVAQGDAAHVLRSFGILDGATHSVPEHLVWYAKMLLPAQRRAKPRRRWRPRGSGGKAAGAT